MYSKSFLTFRLLILFSQNEDPVKLQGELTSLQGSPRISLNMQLNRDIWS